MEILFFIALGLLVLGYFWYTILVSRRNKAREALSGIDVHYNMRFDLIPNILKIAQKFMDHERGLLEEITTLRTQVQKGYDKTDTAAVKDHLGAVKNLEGKMNSLMISVENYPELKSDQTMMQAMQTYSEVEAQIAAARRFYNAAVTSLNNAVQIFPGSLIATLAKVEEMPLFEGAKGIEAPINADSYLK